MSVTLKMFKKVATVFDSSESSGPDCISVMALNNLESDLSSILASFQHVFANVEEISYFRLMGSFIS